MTKHPPIRTSGFNRPVRPAPSRLRKIGSSILETLIWCLRLPVNAFWVLHGLSQRLIKANWEKRSRKVATMIWDIPPGQLSSDGIQILRYVANARYLFRRREAVYGHAALRRLPLTDLFVVHGFCATGRTSRYELYRNKDGRIVFNLAEAVTMAELAARGRATYRMTDPNGPAVYGPSVYFGAYWTLTPNGLDGVIFELVWPGDKNDPGRVRSRISLRVADPSFIILGIDNQPDAMWPVIKLDAPAMTDLHERLAGLFRSTEIALGSELPATVST